MAFQSKNGSISILESLFLWKLPYRAYYLDPSSIPTSDQKIISLCEPSSRFEGSLAIGSKLGVHLQPC